jgi:hypothetical protein
MRGGKVLGYFCFTGSKLGVENCKRLRKAGIALHGSRVSWALIEVALE